MGGTYGSPFFFEAKMAQDTPMVGSNLNQSFADALGSLTPDAAAVPAQPVGAQLFSDFANGLAAQKQASIAGKTAQKQMAIAPDSVADMTPMDRAAAYAVASQTGDQQTLDTINAQANQEELSRRIANTERTGMDYTNDIASSLLRGIGNLGSGVSQLALELTPSAGLGNASRAIGWAAGKMGADGVDEALTDAGNWLRTPTNAARAKISGWNKSLQDTAEEQMSLPSRMALAQSQASQKLDEEASAAQAEAAGGGFWEGSKRFARDFKSGVGNLVDNPLAAQDMVIQQLPQLATGGLSRAAAVAEVGDSVAANIISRAANAAETASIKRSATLAEAQAARASAASKVAETAGKRNAERVADVAERNQIISIGIQEAGGAADQAGQQVLGMSYEDLKAKSPKYNILLESGMEPEDARNALAADAGNIAAITQLPAAMLTGKLAARFETAPLFVGPGTIGQRTVAAAKNIGRETLEEMPQSTTGQIASNLGVSMTADPKQDLLDGAGNAASQGLIGALGMSGTVQAPGVLAPSVATGARAASDAVRTGVQNAAESRRANNKENRAAREDAAKSAANFEEAVNTFDPNAGKANAETPVQEAQDQSTSGVVDTDGSDIPTVAATGDVVNSPLTEATLSNVFSEQGKQAIIDIDAGKGNAAQKLGNVMNVLDNTENLDPSVRRAMEIYANDKLNALSEHRDAINQSLENGEADGRPDMKARLEQQRDAINTIVNHPTAQKLLSVYDEDNLSQEDFDQAISSLPQDITPENVSTPEVQSAFAAIKDRSLTDPLTITGDQYRQVLNHDTSLTPMQRTVMEAKAKIADFIATHDTVSHNIRNDSREEFKSVRDHAKAIFSAMAQKDSRGIQKNLDGLKEFAQKQIDRFNAHDQRMTNVIRTGMFDDDAYTNVPGYYQLDENGNRSKTKLQFVNPGAKGKKNLKAIQDDTNHIVDVYNALASTVPGSQSTQLAQVTPTWENAVPQSATAAEKTVFAEQSGKAQPAPAPEVVPEPTPAPVVEAQNIGLTADEGTRLNELMARTGDKTNPLTAAEKKEATGLLDKQRALLMGEPEPQVSETEVTPVAEAKPATEAEVLAEFTALDNQKEPLSPEQADRYRELERQLDVFDMAKDVGDLSVSDLNANLRAARDPELRKVITDELAKRKETPAKAADKPATKVEEDEAAPEEETVPDSSTGKALLDSIPDGSAALADAKTPAEKAARTNQLKASFQPGKESNYKPGVLNTATPEEIAAVTGYAITDTIQQGLNVFKIGMRTVANQLNKTLKGVAAKHKVAERADSNSPVFALPNMKVLYATKVEDGKVAYIPEFLETMAMAGMHWVASSQPADMDIEQLAKMMGEDESYLRNRPELLKTLLVAGSPVTGVANQMAGMVERLLGIKERNDVSRSYGRTITDSIAREIIEAMANAGIVHLTSIPMESGKVINMVRPVLDKDTQDMKNNLGPAVDIIQDFLLPRDVKGVVLGDAINVVDKNVNGDTWQQIPPQVHDFIKAQQNVPWKLNKDFYDMQSMLGNQAGFSALVAAGYYDGDLSNLNTAHEAIVKSKNLGLVNGAKASDDLVARLDASTDGRDTPIYWKYTMDTNGRTRMDSSFNPQSNKIVREIFNSTEVEVDTTNPQMMREWYLHLAQGLGIKVDKMSNDLAIRDVRRMIGELKLAPQRMGAVAPLMAGIDVMKQGLENGWDSVTKEQANTIIDATRGKDNKYLHTMLSVAKGQLAIENGETTFSHGVTFEVDGKTDGPGNSFVHFGMTDVSATNLDILKKIGWDVNNPDRPSNLTYHETPDMYVTTAANIFSMLPSQSPVLNLLNYAGQVSLNGENIATGLTRSFAKIVVTPATYGSGIRSMSATVTDSIVGALYEHLSDVLSGKDDLNLPMLTALDEMAGTDAFTALASAEPADLKKFSLSDRVQENLEQAMYEEMGDPIFNGINQTVGGALVNNKELSALTNIQGMLFNSAWKAEYNRVREEKVASGELAPNEMLSTRDENAVTKATEHLAPIYQNGISGDDRANGFNMGTMDKNGVTDYLPDNVSNKAVVVTMSGSMKSNGRGTQLLSPGVRTAALSTIGAGDATMMVKGGRKLDDAGVVANNVFDGLDTRVGDMEAASDAINAAVAEGWSENVYQNIITGVAQALKDADLNSLNDKDLRSAFVAVIGNQAYRMSAQQRRRGIPALKSAMDNMVRKHQNMALQNGYVRQALLETKSTISHMGGVDKAYNYGTVEYTGTPEENVLALKARVAELAAADKNAPKVENEAGLVEKLNAYGTSNDGLVTLTRDQLMNALSTFDFGGNRITRELFKRLAPVLGDVTVYHGDRATISQLQAKMHPDVQFSQTANATTYGNTIFLVNANSETLLHEAIHAGIQNVVNRFYGDPDSMTPEQRSSVANMETLLNQFMKMDKQNVDYATALDINHARNNVQMYLSQGDKAAALNEFIAWSLANQNLQDFFGSRTADKGAQVQSTLATIIGRLKNAILKALGLPINRGQSVLAAMAGNFDNLLTQITEAPSLNNPYAKANTQQLNQALNHQGLTTHADYIEGLVTRLTAATNTNVKQMGELLAQTAADRALIQGDAPKINQAVKAFQSAGWVMSPKEQHAFQLMQAVLVSNIQLNPTAMNAMQRLYDSVMPTLTTADLTQSQLDALNGKSTVFTDAHGRSTQLANFIALGATNEGFRDALLRRDIPRRENDTGDLFKKMAKATRDSIDFLADVGNGTRKQKNAREAFDVLSDKISTINMNTKANLADEAANIVGKGDNLVAKQFNKLANKAGDKRDERVLAGKNSTLLEQGVNNILSAVELLDKKSAGLESLQSAINSSKMWTPAKELFTEMLGTSKSSMVINKMLQQAKNQVSSVRQKIRETVPKNVADKFSRELTEAEWSSVTRAFGKTDLQALLSTYSMDDIAGWLKDPTKLAAEVAKVESTVGALEHGSEYLVRSKELAHYLMTGDNISDHLMRNATAISQLVATGRTVKDSAAAVAPIDKLVSLYALEMVEEGHRTAVTSLLDTERSGMDFVGTYLAALNNIEQSKMGNYNPLNGYKGTTPVMDSAHKQLVVATAAEGRKLVENFGFVKLPGYVSDKDLGSNSLSYYFTNENLTAGYTQGALQTVEPLLHGVDPVTGQTTALRGSFNLSKRVANLMFQAKEAKIINAKLGTEGGKLMPIFNDKGKVSGYEAPIPDAVRHEKMGTNTQMHELLGVTQGRQAEETLAQAFNQALADKLAGVWNTDKGGIRKDEYIDLAKSAKTSKVHAQILAAIPRSAQTMLAAAFGGPIMVRADMLNNAFGYRNFSVSALFVNQSDLPAPVQGGLVNVATAIMGAKAPKYMRTVGRYTQDAVSIAKDWVIVRSVSVFTMNLLGNFIQLGQNGVPISQIFKGQAAKMQEVDAYLRNVNKINNLHSDNLGLTDVNQKKRNTLAMQRLLDANARMSITPLIAAGELPTVAEGLSIEDDNAIRGGALNWMDKVIDKLPKGASDAVKLAMIAKGTPLHNGLNRMMTYGDFVAKAVLFDKLVKQDGMKAEDAMRYIQEEFINYDNNPGRTRTWFESHGFTWFLTYKLKIQKILLRRMRDNPLSTLVYQGAADAMGLDTPFEANLAGDNFWYSFSDPTRALDAMSLHPAAQLMR